MKGKVAAQERSLGYLQVGRGLYFSRNLFVLAVGITALDFYNLDHEYFTWNIPAGPHSPLVVPSALGLVMYMRPSCQLTVHKRISLGFAGEDPGSLMLKQLRGSVAQFHSLGTPCSWTDCEPSLACLS